MVTRQVLKGTRVLWETVISPAGKESVDRWIESSGCLQTAGFFISTG